MKHGKKIATIASSILFASACFQSDLYAASEMQPKQKQVRPNFITLVIDDMGFSDIGAFGGEIPTPNLDKLANEGILLTNFYAAPTSSPSRSMLFTGRDNHKVGVNDMGPEAHPSLDEPFFPELISGDYHTIMVGKWHLGHNSESYPYNRGFERSYVMLEGGDTHFLSDAEGNHVTSWSPEKLAKLGRKTYYNENGVEVKEFPPNAYATDLYTDVAVKILEESDKKRPFFLYLSYLAVHSPWQAPENITQKYIDTYSKGWDILRQERFDRQKTLGLVKAETKLPPRPEGLRAWESLTKEEQKLESKRMAVYAAMIDVLDSNVGKLIQYLKKEGLYENTAFFVYSDNGATGHVAHTMTPGHETNYVIDHFVTDFPKDKDHDKMYEKLGDGDCFPTAETDEWAWLSNTPLKGFKGSSFEGGIHTMAFLHYPKSHLKGSKNDCIISVRDISATILDMAEIEYPKKFKGNSISYPPVHYSVANLFKGSEVCQRDRIGFGIEVGPLEVRGLRRGDWKLSEEIAKKGEGKFSLYNVKVDPFEQNDLSEIYPRKYRQMLADYDFYLKTSGQMSSDEE